MDEKNEKKTNMNNTITSSLVLSEVETFDCESRD